MLQHLDEDEIVPIASVELREDSEGLMHVEVVYADGLGLRSRPTMLKTLAVAKLDQSRRLVDYPRWRDLAMFGHQPFSQMNKDKTMNIKKTRKKGVCDAMRCKEEEGLRKLDGSPWGVAEIYVCEKHAVQALEKILKKGTTPEVQDTDIVPAKGEEVSSLKEELQGIEKEAKEVAEMAKDWPIDTQGDLEELSEFLTAIKTQRNETEAQEKEYTRPVNEELKKWRAVFRSAKDALAEAEATLKGRIGLARLRQEADNKKAKEAAAAAHKAGDADGVDENMSKVKNVNETPGINTRLKWTYVVKNLDEVPREWLMLNDKLMKEHCNHSTEKEPEPVPGIEFIPDVVVSGRNS